MSLFRNKEVKLIIVTSFLTFLVFLSTFIFITYNWFNEINKKYINQNTALVGAIISNNPELEEEIVPIITKGNIEQYYTIGNNILDKYYYTENLSSIKMEILKLIDKNKMSVDELKIKLNFVKDNLEEILLDMELKGYIRQVSGYIENDPRGF